MVKIVLVGQKWQNIKNGKEIIISSIKDNVAFRELNGEQCFFGTLKNGMSEGWHNWELVESVGTINQE